MNMPMGPGVIYYYVYHCFIDVHTHATIIKHLLTNLLTYATEWRKVQIQQVRLYKRSDWYGAPIVSNQ